MSVTVIDSGPVTRVAFRERYAVADTERRSNRMRAELDRSASAGREVELCWVRPRVVEKY
ncbi:hypothetical protein ABY42_03775 [Haloferax gibbonsii]|uniref:Uncharacterized protein n=1 Tax=Haloferax gibbonsii TaxID=35746 RepID=A0A0K1IRH0_HALGI|nr:hypothetical protein ABY42_03775 [Haloferax gibbonsii]